MTLGDDKAQVAFADGELIEAVDAIEAILVERDPQVCQRHGMLYVRLAGGTVRASAALLRVRAMRVARFVKLNPRRKSMDYADPPLKLFNALLRKGEWRFPTLDDDPR